MATLVRGEELGRSMKFGKKIDTRLLAGVSLAVFMSTASMVGQAQVNYANTLYESGDYTYCDAKVIAGDKLANCWEEPMPYDAKLKIGRLLQDGYNDAIRSVLGSAD